MSSSVVPSYIRPTSVTIYSDLASNDGAPVCAVRDADILALEWQEAVPGASASSRGYAQITLAADSDALPNASLLRILRIDESMADASIRTWEYRLTEFSDKVDGPSVTLRAAPIIEDWGRQQLRSVSGGVPSKHVTYAPTMATDILSLFLLPAIAADYGISGLTLGTVDAPGLFSYDGTNVTHLQIIADLESKSTRDAWLDRTSETVWTFNLAVRGADATPPFLHVYRNIKALDRDGLIDDNFANRVEPIGETANGESGPTGMEEAMWDAAGTSGVGGRVLHITDPDSTDPIITVDGQLDGKEALTANDPIAFAQLGSASSPVFDTTRRYLWWVEGGETLKGRDVEGDTIVSLNLAQGGNVLAMSYDSSVDRLVVAYSNLSTVLLVNPATPAVANVIGTTSTPLSLSVVSQLSRAYVTTNGSGTQVVNTSAATVALWSAVGLSTQVGRFLYHAASTRLVVYVPGSTAFSVWASPAGAQVGSSVSVGQSFILADDPAQTTMGIVASGALKWGTATISGTPSFSGFATMPAAPGITLSPGDVLSAGGRYYVVGNSSRYVIGWNGSAYTGTVGDLGSVGAYALERGPTTAETANLFAADNVTGIRRLALTVDCSAFEHWTASNSDATNQAVTMPASGSGGPVRIATASGFEARVQFRENPALDYLNRLTDPDSIAAYGVTVDASPPLEVLGKTNYARCGTFDEWRPDDTLRGMSGTYTTAAVGTALATRFRGGEASPVSGHVGTFNGAYTAPAKSVALSGLGAGRILQPGDVLSITDPSTGYIAGNLAFVTQRTVADGSGNATVPITGFGSSALTGASVWYTQPDLGILPGGRTDCPVIYGTTAPFGVLAPIPLIAGDPIAWVTAHLKIACYGGTPNLVKLTVRDPFATSDHTAVVPNQAGDSSAISTGVVIERWLSQKVDMTGLPGHGFVRFTLTPAASIVVYVMSLSVILATDSPADQTTQTGEDDFFDSENPRALWRTAALRLAAGRDPTLQYRCDALEDDLPLLIGAMTNLNDPSRGIFRAGPRIVSVTRFGVGPNMPIREPQIELATAPASFLRAMVDLQSTVRASLGLASGN